MSDYPLNHRFAGRYIRLRERLLNVDFRTLVPTKGPDRWIYIDPNHVVSVSAPSTDDGDVVVITSCGGKEQRIEVAMPVEQVLAALEPPPPAPPVRGVMPWDKPLVSYPSLGDYEHNEVKLGGGAVTGYTRGNIRSDDNPPPCPKCGCGMIRVNSTLCCGLCGAQSEGPKPEAEKCSDCGTILTTFRGVKSCPYCGT